jgi:hypothetical protein
MLLLLLLLLLLLPLRVLPLRLTHVAWLPLAYAWQRWLLCAGSCTCSLPRSTHLLAYTASSIRLCPCTSLSTSFLPPVASLPCCIPSTTFVLTHTTTRACVLQAVHLLWCALLLLLLLLRPGAPPVMMLPLQLAVTTEVLSHVSVCRCRPVKDSRPLTACPLPLYTEVVARVPVKVLHLVVPQGLCIRL